MNRCLFPLLLSMLLLCGCAAQNPLPEPTEPLTLTSTEPAEPSNESGFILDSQENGAIHTYRLEEPVHGFLSMGNHLLVFSGTDTTTLTLLNTETMQVTASYCPDFLLMPENATIQLLDTGISYFNGSEMETVLLDHALREIRRISAPEDLMGMPLLSSDGQTLFYCTPDAIRALDLNTGISRLLKEASYPVQGLSGLLMDDSVLQVSITETDGTWKTLFLSSETGQLLQLSDGNILPATSDHEFFLRLRHGEIRSILYGKRDGSIMTLQPHRQDDNIWFLPNDFRAVTCAVVGEDTVFELYDLNSGLRTAELTIPGAVFPINVTETDDGSIWILQSSELIRWNPSASVIKDGHSYASPYYTQDNPDYDGLAVCSLYAQDIGSRYGIEVLIYKDAADKEPWDYHLEYEFQADILHRELEALDRRLGSFPDGFLQTLASKFTALKICLVRSAEGSPESGSLEAVNGIQFMDGFDAYIVLTTDHDTEYALYHELSHLIETVVLTESTAYDRWDNLNPENFCYDNDYAANQNRDGSAWLKPGAEYFIDTYAMSYPKEDRARLMEYAMTAGHMELFRSPNLQRKLRQMCTGIREAFGLEKSPDTFLWEQYLEEPLS